MFSTIILATVLSSVAPLSVAERPHLTLSAGTVSTADAEDAARRARRGDFDARGRVACAQEQGQALGECAAAVARGPAGNATVVVTFANGFSRSLFFEDRAFVSANATMSGTGTDTDWRVADGVHHIRVDDQRYELPDVFVFGE